MGWAQNFGPSIIRTNQVTVTTGPTLIVAANIHRRRLIITILADGTDLYLGGDDSLTTGNGQLFVQGKGNGYTTEANAAVYGIVTSGSLAVSYLSEDYE